MKKLLRFSIIFAIMILYFPYFVNILSPLFIIQSAYISRRYVNSSLINNISENIQKECFEYMSFLKKEKYSLTDYYEYDKILLNDCLIDKTEIFTLSKISYKNDSILYEMLGLKNDPINSLLSGGDCENIAILNGAILKNLQFKNVYLVKQYEHICIMVENIGNIRFLNCIKDLEYISICKI